jgi:hypothetical protein
LGENEDVELIRVVLSSSATFAAVCLALLTLQIALRESGRLAGMGPRGLRSLRLGSLLALGLIALALSTTLLSFLYLLGHTSLYSLIIWLFPMTLSGVLLGAALAIALLR